MFYEHFYNLYPEYNSNKYNFLVWNISEIFNALIQNSPKWLKVFKLKSMDYPEHEKVILKLSKDLYNKESWNLNEVIDSITKEVKLFDNITIK